MGASPVPAPQPAHPNRRAWIADWIDYLADTRGLSARTINQYATNVDRFLSWHADDPATVAAADLRRYITTRRTRLGRGNLRGADGRLARKSERTYISEIRWFYAWLAATGRIRTDPLADVAVPKAPKPVARDLPDTDVDRLFTYLHALHDVRLLAAFALAFVQGLRVGEIAAATRQALRRGPTPTLTIVRKGGHVQRIRLHPDVAQLLGRVVDGYDRTRYPRGALLEDARPQERFRGKHLSAQYLSSMLSQVMTEAGIADESVHSGRHTLATRMAKLGVPIEVRAEFLSHGLDMAKRYAMGAVDVGIVEALERVSGTFPALAPPVIPRPSGPKPSGPRPPGAPPPRGSRRPRGRPRRDARARQPRRP